MKKYIVEFIGTFFLVITIILAVNNPTLGNLAPLAIGVSLTAIVFASGHISGAHFNPAVTMTMYIAGNFKSKDVLPYILAQLLAGGFAAILGQYLLSGAENESLPLTFFGYILLPAIIAEILGTFVLCYVILNVATTNSNKGNSFYGLAIGFTVMGMIYIFGPISGAMFNPAVAFGVCITEMMNWSEIWLYILGSCIGSLMAAYSFLYLYERLD